MRASIAGSGRPAPPRARRRPTRRRLFGREYCDEYAYLRERDDADTRHYIADENAYIDAVTASWQKDMERLYAEMRARVSENDCSVPERIGGYWYYTRIEAGQEYPLHCRKLAHLTAAEEVYLDEPRLARGHEYFDLASLELSPCHDQVAYSVDCVGEERYQIRLRDLRDGSEPAAQIVDAGSHLAWGESGCLYYTRVDETARPNAVYLHRLGQPASEDLLLYHEPDPAFHVNLWVSRSRVYLFVESCSNMTSEVHYMRLGDPSRRVRSFAGRRSGIEYYLDHRGDRFLVLTNEDAPGFRLLSVAIDANCGHQTDELIAGRSGVSLAYVEAYAHHLVIGELHRGIEHLRVIDDAGGDRYLHFDDPVYDIAVEDLVDYEADFIRVHYSSPIQPPHVMDYDLSAGSVSVRKRDRLRDHDPQDYVCRRRSVITDDGAAVPLTVVHARDLALDGSHPLLLFGYGAYGEVVDVDFDADLVSLMRRGVVVAMAHVRGGGELGSDWHEGGRLLQKENSYRDFHACMRWLTDAGYTAVGRIAVWGASAGGLLVAVTANRHPEYLAAVVAEVPFVDVLNTMLDPSLPLTVHDFEEFGDPRCREYFDYLRGYSPYDNVTEQAYPAICVSAGLDDPRVGYWEPLKWVARLRAAKTDDRLLLLKLDRGGHYGASGRYSQWRQTAMYYIFLLRNWGIPI